MTMAISHLDGLTGTMAMATNHPKELPGCSSSSWHLQVVADHADPDEGAVVLLETARRVGRLRDIFVPQRWELLAPCGSAMGYLGVGVPRCYRGKPRRLGVLIS